MVPIHVMRAPYFAVATTPQELLQAIAIGDGRADGSQCHTGQCKVSRVHVLGLRAGTRGTKRVIFSVIIEVSTGDVVDCIEHVCNPSHDEATQARELRDALNSVLSAYQDLAVAVLFEADYNAKSRISKGTKDRLRLEGAALTACLDRSEDVHVMNGPTLGRACGGTKQDVLDAAERLGVSKEYVEAAAAALGARSLA